MNIHAAAEICRPAVGSSDPVTRAVEALRAARDMAVWINNFENNVRGSVSVEVECEVRAALAELEKWRPLEFASFAEIRRLEGAGMRTILLVRRADK